MNWGKLSAMLIPEADNEILLTAAADSLRPRTSCDQSHDDHTIQVEVSHFEETFSSKLVFGDKLLEGRLNGEQTKQPQGPFHFEEN